MSDVTIDRLAIEVEAKADGSVSSIDELSRMLGNLKKSTAGGMKGLEATARSIEKLQSAVSNFSPSKAMLLTSMVQSLKNLEGLQDIRISASIGNQIANISNALRDVSSESISKISSLSDSLKSLEDLRGLQLSKVGTPFKNITNSVKELRGEDLSKFGEQMKALTTGLKAFESIGKNNAGTLINSLRKIPEIAQGLKDMNLDDFTKDVERLSLALKPLSDGFARINTGISKLPENVRRASSSLKQTETVTSRLAQTLNSITNTKRFFGSLLAGYAHMRSSVGLANQYIEDINLFNVSLGEYAKEARNHAEAVSDIVGIDPGQWMKNQGVFMTLAEGFGVASDKAYTMSRNLTQLGYDISSFFNIDVDQAMLKVQSGLAGELEPMRRIGYDLSKARMEIEATNLGIKTMYKDMTQADKSMLRYYAMLTQVTVAQTDMARTLNDPANQLRVLRAQAIQLARAFGNLFIPALNAVLPYLIAMTKGLRMVIDHIGMLLGFQLPEVDLDINVDPVKDSMGSINDIDSGIGNIDDGVKGVGDGLKDANKKAKELRATILSFDNLNVLNEQPKDIIDKATGKGGKDGKGSGLGVGTGSNIDFPLPEYDFLSGLVETRLGKVEERLKGLFTWIKDHLDLIFDTVTAIGAGLLTWKIANTLNDFIKWLGFGGIPTDKVVGLTIAVTGFVLGGKGAYNLGYKGMNWPDFLQTLLGASIGAYGVAQMLGFTPAGWAIGIGLALVVTAVSFIAGRSKREYEEEVKKRFGEIILSPEEIQELARQFFSKPIYAKLDFMIEADANVAETRKSLEKSIKELRFLNARIEIGIDVNKEVYTQAIDEFVKQGQAYIDDSKISWVAGIDVLFNDDATSANSWKEEGLKFFTSLETVFSEKGKDLKKVLSEAFVDGEWIPDKLKEAMKIQQEMADVINRLDTAEHKAKMSLIKNEIMTTENLSKETFDSFLQQIDDDTNARIKALQENYIKTASMSRQVLEEKYREQVEKGILKQSEVDKMIESELKKMEDAFFKNKLEIQLDADKVKLDSITEKFSEEIDSSIPFMKKEWKTLLSDSYPRFSELQIQGYMETDVDSFMKGMEMTYLKNFKFLEGATAQMMSEYLEVLEPTFQQRQDLARTHRQLGEELTPAMREGLLNEAHLKALAGSQDHIYYLMGMQALEGDEAIKLAQIYKKQGGSIPIELANAIKDNTSFVYDESGKMIIGIKNSVTGTMTEITPDILESMRYLGLTIPQEMIDGVRNRMPEETQKYKRMLEDMQSTAYNGMLNQSRRDSMRNPITVDVFVKTPNMVSVWDKIARDFRNASLALDATVGWKVSGKTSQPRSPNVRLGHDSMFASGGFPTVGEMFIAREAGPELVGTIGGSTAVVNNDQIVESVSSGVYRAVVSAMGGDKGDIVVNVMNPNEVTGREVYRQSVAKSRREGARV